MTTHPEQKLISALVRTGEYQHLASLGITSDLFHVYKKEMIWIERYISSKSKSPSKTAFKGKFPDFSVIKVDDVEHWCGEVKQNHARTQIIDLMERSIEMIDNDDLESAVELMRVGVTDVQTKIIGSSPSFDVFADWEETFETVKARYDHVKENGIAGVPSGFRSFDSLTGGFQPGWLILIAARLGVGKTWTTVKSAVEGATLGKTVTYFSLEQSRNQIAMRVHSFTSKRLNKKIVFDSKDLTRGEGFDIDAYHDFLASLKERVPGNLIIHDKSRGPVGMPQIVSAIEQDQPDVVFIDYITKMDMPSSRGEAWQAIGKLSGELQDAAQRYNVPIVCGAQVNRAGAGRDAPDSDTLSGADKLGQDADILITMQAKSEHVMMMKLQKNRHGPHGVRWMNHFNPGKGIFDEVTDERAAELTDRDKDVK